MADLAHTPFELDEPVQDLPPAHLVAQWLAEHERRPLHERRLISSAAWAKLLRGDVEDPGDTKAAATLLAWRTIRAHLYLAGRLEHGDALHHDATPPYTPIAPGENRAGIWLDAPSRIRHRAVLDHIEEQPASLHPDPHGNGTLDAWKRTTHALLGYLGVPLLVQPCVVYPNVPRDLPRRLLLDPFETGWPTHEEVILFEHTLVGEHLDAMIKKGVRVAHKDTAERYGLTDQEAYNLDRLAKRRGAELARINDLEEERAFLVHQLDDAISRTVEPRTLAQLLAKRAVVLGITRAEPEDQDVDVIRTIARVSREAREIKAGPTGPTTPPTLEGEGRLLPPPGP